MRQIRKYCPELNFFTQPEFTGFKKTLDAEMKRLKAGGAGLKKKRVEPISLEEEEILWQTGLLGSATPQTLLHTMVFMCGVYFALRSGQEHRDLQCCQIKVNEAGNGLVYTESHSKNNPGGLKHRKVEAKVVSHFADSTGNKDRCFVRLYKLYVSLCPQLESRKSNAFYLTPLRKPKGKYWYSIVPVGHNTLQLTVHRLCSAAGIEGYKTNHSLRVTAATRLYQAGVDEQLIMKRTGHRSIEGVRIYKRVSDEQEQAVSAILQQSSSTTTITTRATSIPQDKPDDCPPPLKLQKTTDDSLPLALNLSNCTNITITIQK